jgi:hypothetical protein
MIQTTAAMLPRSSLTVDHPTTLRPICTFAWRDTQINAANN